MQVRVRMYRQGLGDCFLLTFGAPPAERHVLIDCGTLGATTTHVPIGDVIADIQETTGGHLDLLVATHEHKDHVSGFGGSTDRFKDVVADHVWLAWTEDAGDELAQQIAKHKGDLITAAKLAASALTAPAAARGPDPETTASLGAGIRRLLAFYDEEALGATLATTVNEAMAYVQHKAPSLELLRPGTPPLELDWLPGVRVYVLGPPRDAAALANLGEHGSPELYELAGQAARELAGGAPFFAAGKPLADFSATLEADERQELSRVLPFDPRHRLEEGGAGVRERFAAYYRPADDWRRVDHDWLSGAADLALQLDGMTNNTSLALAFELLDDGRVLLFPADAQLGNWLSWHDLEWQLPDGEGGTHKVTVGDLLGRTVLYKVGHHSSHNATLKEGGLELMDSLELAMIPVDRKVALAKKPPWLMPARELYRALLAKAGGRVVRSDVGWAARDDPDFQGLVSEDDAAQQWTAWEAAQQAAPVEVKDLCVDWVVGAE